MHVHIIGICGTFMAGLGILAKEKGYKVTGSDARFLPPMSTQLKNQDIGLYQGFDVHPTLEEPDLWVIGNVATRGMPLVEQILAKNKNYTSGPDFLAKELIKDRCIIGIAGTHGKTTVASLITWFLESNGLNPGYLIGGMPLNFKASARLGSTNSPFVVEADEYDTAFFDKRSKFLHFKAKYVLLNNLEFDHADIFSDLTDIKRQFHHWIRTLSKETKIFSNRESKALNDVIKRGMWSKINYFNDLSELYFREVSNSKKNCFDIFKEKKKLGMVNSPLIGVHNMSNVTGAYYLANEFGIDIKKTNQYLENFKGVKRRLEQKADLKGVKVFDDFAHHPTAVRETINAFKKNMLVQDHDVINKKLIVVFEPRSNSMKLGSMQKDLSLAFDCVDYLFVYSKGIEWDAEAILDNLKDRLTVSVSIEKISNQLYSMVDKGDSVIFMSNGSFDGLVDSFVARLANKS